MQCYVVWNVVPEQTNTLCFNYFFIIVLFFNITALCQSPVGLQIKYGQCSIKQWQSEPRSLIALPFLDECTLFLQRG